MNDVQKREYYRPIARRRAEAYSGSMRDVAISSRKRHTLNMDLQHEYAIFFASLPVDDREMFDSMYAAELENLEQKKHSDASIIEQKDRFFAWIWVALLVSAIFIAGTFAIT